MARQVTINGKVVTAYTGQYLRCDSYGRPLAVVATLTNGLGLVYQLDALGRWQRVIF